VGFFEGQSFIFQVWTQQSHSTPKQTASQVLLAPIVTFSGCRLTVPLGISPTRCTQ
jgi:hypothetical protein